MPKKKFELDSVDSNVVEEATLLAPTESTTNASLSKPKHNHRFNSLIIALVVLILFCLSLCSALWLQHRQFVSAGESIANQLETVNNKLILADQHSSEAITLVHAQASKIKALEEAKLELNSQYKTLEQAWQNFNGTAADSILVSDIERLLNIANQELRLTKNVSNAIVALETAQSRLALADRPRFMNLRYCINADLDRLRMTPAVDIAAQFKRIERLVALIDQAPLIVPEPKLPLAVPSKAEPSISIKNTSTDQSLIDQLSEKTSWWQRYSQATLTWTEKTSLAMLNELKSLIRVQRVDEPNVLWLNATQAEQLRSSLRQRLLTAQLALMMRQPLIWKSELALVSKTFSTYFDKHALETLTIQTLLQELAKIEIDVAIPDLSNSLNAVTAMMSSISSEQD